MLFEIIHSNLKFYHFPFFKMYVYNPVLSGASGYSCIWMTGSYVYQPKSILTPPLCTVLQLCPPSIVHLSASSHIAQNLATSRWRTRTWFPLILSLVVRTPWKLPFWTNLLSQMDRMIWHPQPGHVCLWKLFHEWCSLLSWLLNLSLGTATQQKVAIYTKCVCGTHWGASQQHGWQFLKTLLKGARCRNPPQFPKSTA